MLEKIKFIGRRIREGRLQDMLHQTKWIYQYARRYWLAIIFYTFIGLLGTGIALGSNLVSKDLIDMITGHQTGALLKTFCAMVGLALGSIVINQFSSYISNWISMKVDNEIKADIFSRMLVTDWESIASYHTGDLLTRWSSDASAISNGILNWIPSLIINTFKFISAFAIVIYYDATFAIFSFVGIPVTLLMSKTLMNRMINNNKRSADLNARMSGFNQEAFSNIQTIKAFDLIPLYVRYLKNLQKEYLTMRMDFQRMSMFSSILMAVVGLIVSYTSYGWGIYRVWAGIISYGTMTMFLSLSGTLTGTLNSLISLVPNAISITTSAGRLMDILEMPKEDFSQDEAVIAFEQQNKTNGIRLKATDIDYTYANGACVFQAASLVANPHEIIALVGPSGEGKTTMLRLLLALLTPQNGTLCLENVDGSEALPLTPSCRKVFSYVPQGNTMFSGTIAENMRNVKPDATDEEIIKVLKMACAWDFVNKLPTGIETPLKERGGGLSEGQAQRLSIARALLRRSPILLLDEATSALDVATERRILKQIQEDKYPRTCIVTTHRPSVLNICNRVYRIQDKACVILDQKEIDTMIHDF
nr:ABC transporter ATP-binding protein [Eubacterium sp.]